MKNAQKKNALIGLLLVIILALITLIILMATGTLSFNKDVEEENHNTSEIDYNNIYSNFINSKKYNTENIVEEYSKVSYSIYDINQDGSSELLLRFQELTSENLESEWDYISIYAYNKENDEVSFIQTLYAWDGVKYNTETQEIIYTELKTTGLGDGTRGNSLNYYKLVNNKLELTRTISYIYNLSTNITTYTEKTLNGEEKQITNEEYNSINKNEIKFTYQEVSNN